MSMANDENEPQPTPTAADVAGEIERTHAAVLAAIEAGYANVENAMKQAEEAVAQAVSGAARAVQLARQASQKVDG